MANVACRYTELGKPLCDAFVIGIAGGSASGKVGGFTLYTVGRYSAHLNQTDIRRTGDCETAWSHSNRDHSLSGTLLSAFHFVPANLTEKP